jgi:hypothetical protein
MSERDLAQAREDFERLETRTAKSVVEFHRKRRGMRSIASPPMVPEAAATPAALAG